MKKDFFIKHTYGINYLTIILLLGSCYIGNHYEALRPICEFVIFSSFILSLVNLFKFLNYKMKNKKVKRKKKK